MWESVRYGIAFGEEFSMSSPSSRSQMLGKHKRQSFAESGFGGWVGEKAEIAREALLLLSQKKLHPQHLTIPLAKLPKGSLVKKKIKGHEYYYLEIREKDRVRFIYKGKLSDKEIEKYKQAKEYRAKYRKLLSQIKKQIKFLVSVQAVLAKLTAVFINDGTGTPSK
jgi:hypothetical protein